MDSDFYWVQTALTSNIGPSSDSYQQIQGLDTLIVDDIYLEFGGVAALNLFLGFMWSGDIYPFNLYVSIVETTTGTTVTEVLYEGANGMASPVSISAVYSIPANTKPAFVAQWKVLGTIGVQLMAPTTMSFSALVYENNG